MDPLETLDSSLYIKIFGYGHCWFLLHLNHYCSTLVTWLLFKWNIKDKEEWNNRAGGGLLYEGEDK